MINLVQDIDFSELCITSDAKIKESKSDEIVVETIKAVGNKCPVCWKIVEGNCSRQSCPII